MIDKEYIIWAYRLLLERDPESTAVIIEKQKHEKSINSLVKTIIESDEYKELFFEKNNFQLSNSDITDSKVIFLHLPKTGGTTLHHILTSNFKATDICPERFNGLQDYPAGKLAKYRLFSGHFDLLSTKIIPGKSNKYITLFRDPCDRLVSLYYFQRAHKEDIIKKHSLRLADLANKYDIHDFFSLEEIKNHPAINNSMIRMFSTFTPYRWENASTPHSNKTSNWLELLENAKNELESITSFGLLEKYRESVDLICSDISIPSPEVIKKRQVLLTITNEEPGLKPIKTPPPEQQTLKLINKLVEYDNLLYEHAKTLFNNKLATFNQKN